MTTVLSLSLSLLYHIISSSIHWLAKPSFSSTEVLAAISKVQASHLVFFLTVHCFPLDRQSVVAFSWALPYNRSASKTGLDQDCFQALRKSSGVKIRCSTWICGFHSNSPSFQKWCAPPQGNVSVAAPTFYLLCPKSLYFSLSSPEPHCEIPCRNLAFTGFKTWLHVLLLMPTHRCSALFSLKRHKRCSLGQQESSKGQKVSKPVSWLLFMGTRLWKWYYIGVGFFLVAWLWGCWLVYFLATFPPPIFMLKLLKSEMENGETASREAWAPQEKKNKKQTNQKTKPNVWGRLDCIYVCRLQISQKRLD